MAKIISALLIPPRIFFEKQQTISIMDIFQPDRGRQSLGREDSASLAMHGWSTAAAQGAALPVIIITPALVAGAQRLAPFLVLVTHFRRTRRMLGILVQNSCI